MRRISTLFIAACCLMLTNKSFSQLCTPVPNITTVATYTFDTDNEGFSGDFTQDNGPDVLQSTTAGSGVLKQLYSPTFLAPNNITNLEFGFTLAGAADVPSYSIKLRYSSGGTIQTIDICSGNALPNGTYNFSFPMPAQVIGNRFQIEVDFNVIGSVNQVKTIDNFRVNVTEAQISLPVKISTLEARTINSTTSLAWNVAGEENVSGYDVERSYDGRSFSKIAFVPATGQSRYTYVDVKPLEATTYYRVKSVDVDGKFTYSTIASLRKGGKSTIVLRAFPMPAIKDITIEHATAIRGSQLTISSEDGRLIRSIVPASGTQQTLVDLSSVKPGLYIVRYSNGNGEVESMKLIKQ